jgi:hypothetical protein
MQDAAAEGHDFIGGQQAVGGHHGLTCARALPPKKLVTAAATINVVVARHDTIGSRTRATPLAAVEYDGDIPSKSEDEASIRRTTDSGCLPILRQVQFS